MSTFADLIHRHRSARRWSQAYLACEANLSAALVSRLESGKRNATPASIAALAEAFGLPVWERDELYLAAGLVPPDVDTTRLGHLLRNLPRTTAPSAP
jgi:transcriptional regulator with XRE-family HTH domain